VAGPDTEEPAPLVAAQGPIGSEARGQEDALLKEATVALSMVKGKRTKVVTVGITKTQTRQSTMNTGAASHIPALEKAQRHAAEKSLDSSNFSALDAYPDSHLSYVVKDNSLVFTPSAGTPLEALSLIRAKEKAHAALAEAAFRKSQAVEAATGEAESVARDAALQVEVHVASPMGGPSDPPVRPVHGVEEAREAQDTNSAGASPLMGEVARRPATRSLSRGARIAKSTLAVKRARGKKKLVK
jgi:hypothetical protein